MTATARQSTTLSALLAAISLAAGCATSSPAPTLVHRDATEALIRHPQFHDAARSAPQFVTEALQVITRYEAELATRSR
jgi:hypothetical protein